MANLANLSGRLARLAISLFAADIVNRFCVVGQWPSPRLYVDSIRKLKPKQACHGARRVPRNARTCFRSAFFSSS